MADIDFNPDEVLRASCAWRSLVLVQYSQDILTATIDDASSEISLLNERISYLERKISSIDKDRDKLDQEKNLQENILAEVANNAFSRLGEEATSIEDFDLVFNDDVVKGAVVGMSRVVKEKE